MARIYIGRSTGIGAFERYVVLKLILPEKANDTVAINMFLDEARLVSSLNHQNVAQVFDVGEEAGLHFLAMEFVHGQDLRSVLATAGAAGTRIPYELGLAIVGGAAAGLHHAHERRGPDGKSLGIVHRDVSPSNIMIGYDGSIKVLDFGIAKATARSAETVSGMIKGKFAYMSPEQCRGRDVDRRSDVFALGIILYELTTQHRCFRAESDFDTMHRIVTGDIVQPVRLLPDYPLGLQEIVLKALAVDATQRYQTAGALLEALEQFSTSSRISMSTMALGRFMRSMFGDVPEPWVAPDRDRLAIATSAYPKETTVSNTNDSAINKALPTIHVQASSPGSAPLRPSAPPVRLPTTASYDVQEQDDEAAWNHQVVPSTQPQFLAGEAPSSEMRQHNEVAKPTYGQAIGPYAVTIATQPGPKASPAPDAAATMRMSSTASNRVHTPSVVGQATGSPPAVPQGAANPLSMPAPTPTPVSNAVNQGNQGWIQAPTPTAAPSWSAAPGSQPAQAAYPPSSQPPSMQAYGSQGPSHQAAHHGAGLGQHQGAGLGQQGPMGYPFSQPRMPAGSAAPNPFGDQRTGSRGGFDTSVIPKRTGLWIGLGVVAVALIVLVVVGFASGGNDAAAQLSDAALVGATPTGTPDAAVVAIAPVEAAGGSANPQAIVSDTAGPSIDARLANPRQVDAHPPSIVGTLPAIEKMVSLTVHSEPPGADVTLNGKRLGLTPWVGTVGARSTGRLVLRRDNFQPIHVTIPLDEPLSKSFSMRKTERASTVTPPPCIPANKVNIYDPEQVKRKCK